MYKTINYTLILMHKSKPMIKGMLVSKELLPKIKREGGRATVEHAPHLCL